MPQYATFVIVLCKTQSTMLQLDSVKIMKLDSVSSVVWIEWTYAYGMAIAFPYFLLYDTDRIREKFQDFSKLGQLAAFFRLLICDVFSNFTCSILCFVVWYHFESIKSKISFELLRVFNLLSNCFNNVHLKLHVLMLIHSVLSHLHWIAEI